MGETGVRSIKQCQLQSLYDQSHHLVVFFFQHWSQTGMGALLLMGVTGGMAFAHVHKN